MLRFYNRGPVEDLFIVANGTSAAAWPFGNREDRESNALIYIRTRSCWFLCLADGRGSRPEGMNLKWALREDANSKSQQKDDRLFEGGEPLAGNALEVQNFSTRA